ncbi:sialic acid-binding Ig-like lectin 7 isoform X2 [Carassius gibelio]|uniref:sialic acid-binding Ig-like lectin 7 isoform X2 n=1 Tax=Carassius gibelio TaxID=101364 RepID=UPI00227777AF|nr:sialic acid-binding Ig-like lectin 7 isoform X2 [Carassius gibelio]
MSSTLRTLMAGNQITSFIFISSVLVHTHSGSCVQIPCTFHISDFEDKRNKAESIYGIWLKNKSQFGEKDSFIAFNSSENIIRGFSDIEITGNLSERNCTTVFNNIMKNHSDLYYFRLEMEPVFRVTFNPSTDVTKKTVRINVRDSPQPPELKLSKPVMEETTVNLICSAEAPCPKQPPTVSWSNIPKSAHSTTQLQEKPDKTQSVVSKLTFKVSYKDNRRNITCTATYPRNTPDASTVETIVMLRVLFPPKETHIIITPSVGTNVSLTCKSSTNPSNDLNYTWYKHGEETPIAWGIKINLTQTQIGSYLCTAQNKYGNQSSEEVHHTGQSGLSHLVIFGCTGGLLAFFLLSAVFFYSMRTKASRQAHVIGSDQAEDRNRDTMAICTNNVTAISKNGEKKETDDLHYGEIDFSKLQTGHKTEELSNNVSETEYSELQVTQR